MCSKPIFRCPGQDDKPPHLTGSHRPEPENNVVATIAFESGVNRVVLEAFRTLLLTADMLNGHAGRFDDIEKHTLRKSKMVGKTKVLKFLWTFPATLNPNSPESSSMVHNRCGRNGCPSNVRRGMQCHTCKAWWHFKCTGLQDDQLPLHQGCNAFPKKEESHKNKTNSPLPNHTVQCKCSSLIDVLATKLELLSKALTDANTKNAAIWTKVDKELSSLNEYLALSTPGPLAAKSVIRLSDAAIKTATASIVDRRIRESRLIIWGSFSRKITPTKQAQSLLGSVLSKSDHESLHADWLHQKGSKRTLGLLVTLSSPSAVQRIMGQAVSVQKANPTIRRLSGDRPLDARKLGHSSSREEVRKMLPDGANSADPKLKTKPIVVIAPCAPESTPRQTTATPDSSFYSTIADPSNAKGSDAPEEASLTWTERPKYVELSALLSVTDVKGATVNSTPKLQPSWIGSDERSQVAKPTGKPTTCADVDIGECCENLVAQDHDSQSLKPDHGEPNSPSYTQLATLIAGDSDDHTGAKERRLRPNKPYTTSQIRKLLAGFKVQSSEKTSLMGAPPKELPATQRSKPHRDTFPTKPCQHAQEAKQTQDRPLSNSNLGRPKDVSEWATSSNGRNFRPRGKNFVHQSHVNSWYRIKEHHQTYRESKTYDSARMCSCAHQNKMPSRTLMRTNYTTVYDEFNASGIVEPQLWRSFSDID
ncbi:hypothetical protein CLF_103675 [Clonorchis sinensis]|uniref:Uncharacterized protein n=1 Tax=Clonorchis sinensis TaxID=79923 RepID=G7YA64_CLOSI|nr:hypothetical protein CLF_103675 [Clonorchis sinensis]